MDTDTSATLRITASLNGVPVGTNTAISDYQGVWPSGTLSFSSPQTFNNVVIHYDRPPPTGGDYGVIFAADNMLVTPAIPAVLAGDFNQDGVVDAADYVTWRAGLGIDYTPADYDTWRVNFGQTAGSGSLANGSVPEPATFVLLTLSSAGWCLGRFNEYRKLVAKRHTQQITVGANPQRSWTPNAIRSSEEQCQSTDTQPTAKGCRT